MKMYILPLLVALGFLFGPASTNAAMSPRRNGGRPCNPQGGTKFLKDKDLNE